MKSTILPLAYVNQQCKDAMPGCSSSHPIFGRFVFLARERKVQHCNCAASAAPSPALHFITTTTVQHAGRMLPIDFLV